jgi:hypothetical protein
LTVNATKSAVASVFGRKFLGSSFWRAANVVIKRKVAVKPLTTFKPRIRQLTGRSGGRSLQDVVDRLRPYVRGWKTYFRPAQTLRVWRALDPRLRHRLRASPTQTVEARDDHVSFSNRPVQTRMPGGVAGGATQNVAPYPDWPVPRRTSLRIHAELCVSSN